MSLLKCKMCGGELEISEGMTVCECEYCGAKQTVPSADSEKKMTLFNRANRLRFNCEFDKASGVYESIIADFPEEAEAYWGLVLCKYGIEYVDDPATAKKIPTCHRSSFESVMDDNNFEQVMENADTIARVVYREEAKQIEELRKSIIEVSSKEEPYDIFICYKETDENGDRTVDSVIAQDVYNALNERGYKVFFSRITLEDKLGQKYEPYIFAALNSAKVMLAFGTNYEYYNAVWVKNEWSRFLQLIAKGEKKTLIPCYKNIDAYDMPKEFAKLQAQDMGKVGAVQDLLRGIEKILPKNKGEINEVPNTSVTATPQSATTDSLLKRAFMFLEDENWKDADTYCEKVLDIDPENTQAYIGKLCCSVKCKDFDDLKNVDDPFDNNEYYKKCIRYGNNDVCSKLNSFIEYIKQRNDENRLNAIYNNGKSIMQSAKSETDYLTARDEFAKIREWKDSNGLFNECIQKAEVARRNVLYQNAIEKMKNKQYLEAIESYKESGIKDYEEQIIKCQTLVEQKLKLISEKHQQSQVLKDYFACEYHHLLGLNFKGRVLAAEEKRKYSFGECKVSSWKKVKKVFVHKNNSFAITNDGKVLFTQGHGTSGTKIDIYHYNRLIKKWKNITELAFGENHYVGLCNDGHVVATGFDHCGQTHTKSWTDIVKIDCGTQHTVGLKSNGHVVAIGNNRSGQCNVNDWENIVSIACGGEYTVGLKADGTVVATGSNDNGQCDVSSWKNVMDIYTAVASSSHRDDIYCTKTYGITVEGTVLSTDKYNEKYYKNETNIVDIVINDNNIALIRADGTIKTDNFQNETATWKDIVSVRFGHLRVIGLKSNGTVVYVANQNYGDVKLDVGKWKLFNSVEDICNK